MTTTPPPPTLTVHVDENPCPRIDILFSGLANDAATITVWRNYAGQRSVVRGVSNTPVSRDALFTDYECPLQTPVTYTCVTFDTDGTPSQLSSTSDPATVDEPRAWLQDPLDPTSAMPIGLVRLIAGLLTYGSGPYGVYTYGGSFPADPAGALAVLRKASFASVTRSADVTVSPIFGSDLPMAGSSVRRQASEIPIEIRTADEDTTTALRNLLQQAVFPCLRSGARLPMMAPLAYLAIPDVIESFIYGPDVTIWTMTAQSVAPPGAAVLVATRTYDDLPDEASSYSDLQALYDTYIDLLRGS